MKARKQSERELQSNTQMCEQISDEASSVWQYVCQTLLASSEKSAHCGDSWVFLHSAIGLTIYE